MSVSEYTFRVEFVHVLHLATHILHQPGQLRRISARLVLNQIPAQGQKLIIIESYCAK